MDIAETWEVQTILNFIPYADRNLWEVCRYQMFTVAQVNSKKKIQPKELMKYAWDRETEEKKVEISDEEIKRMKNRMKTIQRQINQKK